MIALGVIARGYRWGVVALGVVVGKEKEEETKETQNRLISIGHIKTHNTKFRCYGNPSNTCTKPPKLSVPSFRRILVRNLTVV